MTDIVPSVSSGQQVATDKRSTTWRHDLNNMFGAVTGSLKFIQQYSQLDDKQRLLIGNALNSINEMYQYILDLMAEGIDNKSGKLGFHPQGGQGHNHMTFAEGYNRHDLFFAAIEMTRMPMIVTDPNQPDNPIVFANQAFLNTTGYAMEEIIHKNCRFLQGKDSDPEVLDNIRKAIRTKTDIAVELQNYRKDGTMFWNALFISPIFDHHGNLLFFFGSQLDITRRREAENALRRAQKLESIGQLTGSIAHDFNNLLQVMIGNLQMASHIGQQPDKLSRYHESALQAAQKAKILTQQLLAFSRKQPLEARVVNLNRILTEIKELLIKTVGHNIRIEMHLAPNLANMHIDIIQLEMAVINILANSRDAMPDGGIIVIETKNIQISKEHIAQDKLTELKPGEYVALSIKDNGNGISEEVLARITEPFFTTKDVGKGTGLGLAQVYGFVQQSEGGFVAESTLGKGTNITLVFPASASQVEHIEQTYSAPVQHNLGKGERILLVEDNAQVRELAYNILYEEGYKVFSFENAEEAYQQIINQHLEVDMLFTDIVMPGKMNGVALAKAMRKKVPDMAILVTTGFAEDVHGHTNSNEFETIYKPYMPDELAKKVRSVLNRKSNHRS